MSRYALRFYFLAMVMFVSHQVQSSQPVHIEVFTKTPNSVTSVRGYKITVFDMRDFDERSNGKVKAPTFSANVDQAKRDAKRWIQTREGQRFIQAIKEAHEGPRLAIKYQLESIPAVVFNRGESVVYGTHDIRKALQDYYRFIK